MKMHAYALFTLFTSRAMSLTPPHCTAQAPAQVAEKVVKQPSPCNNSSSAIDNTQQPLQTAQNVSRALVYKLGNNII